MPQAQPPKGILLFYVKVKYGKSVQHRLVEQVHQKRVLSQKIQQRQLPFCKELFIPAPLCASVEEVKTGDKQEKPGQQGKIVGGKEAAVGKSQIGRQTVPVKPCRQRAEGEPFKPQGAAAAVAKKYEQRKAEGRTYGGRQLPKSLLQRSEQQHAAADAGENAEEDPVFRHHKSRDQRYRHTAAKHQQTPFHMAAAHAPAEAGQQDEGPADELLPAIAGGGIVPGQIHAEQIHKVPQPVVDDHIQQQKAPQGIQQMKSCSFFYSHNHNIRRSIPPLIRICGTGLTLLSG